VLLQSKNYVTKRQSLKLLGELLLNRSNFKVMMKYINSPDNLKIMMNLLRGTTKAIQFEAFHVFKIFVANPKKSPRVLDILVRNKDKLMEFLSKFQKDKDDEQFNEEKNILLATLRKLDISMLETPAAVPSPSTTPTAAATSTPPTTAFATAPATTPATAPATASSAAPAPATPAAPAPATSAAPALPAETAAPAEVVAVATPPAASTAPTIEAAV
jgi:calcium binding protein 39